MNPIIESNQTAFELINPTTLYNPQPFGYSHVAEVKEFKRILHISGQGGENQQGVLAETFEAQLRQTFSNIKLALSAVNATLSDIAVLKILVVNHDQDKHQVLIHEMHKIWQGKACPACTLIPVQCLALKQMMIEVEVTAYSL